MARETPVLVVPSSPPLIVTGIGVAIENENENDPDPNPDPDTEIESNPSFHLDTLPSSDLPFFSSDDLQSSTVENYYPENSPGVSIDDHLNVTTITTTTTTTTPPSEGSEAKRTRRKRAYCGTWWGEEITPKRSSRRTRKRTRTAWKDKGKVDSGVFIPSDDDDGDDSTSTDDDIFTCHPYAPTPKHSSTITALSRLPVCTTPVRGRIDRQVRCQEPREPENIICAKNQINRCLEEGDDWVDISYHHLKEIPTHLLKPLTALVKQPAKEIGRAPSEHIYAPLVPRFHLFLNANNLRAVNPVIFELKRFGMLNLFCNEIATIPDSIENVRSLCTLNVAANRLRTLPWSIMRLIRQGNLRHLIAHPNPFVKPDGDGKGGEDEDEDENGSGVRMTEPFRNTLADRERNDQISHQKPSAPVLVTRSCVEYFDGEGNRSPPSPPPSAASYSRSLRETALQAYIRATVNIDREAGQLALHLPELPPSVVPETQGDDDDHGPSRLDRILPMLERALNAHRGGGNICSVCSRPFIIPRVQWVEWWDCHSYEGVYAESHERGNGKPPLPFLRRGCSLACLPERNGEELTGEAKVTK